MASQLDQRSEECNRLVFEAVNETSLSKLKLANGTYTPSQLLTSLAQCNEEGETPLIAAMRKKNISIIEEMVTWMLDYKNHLFHKKECKSMPIFIIEQFSHDISVLPSDGFHEDFREDGKSWLELIGLVFLQSTSLTRQDKIIALELIGALAIIHCCNSTPQHALMPLKCWREAMTLRYFPQDGEPLLPKVPANCVPTQASSVIFGSATEIMTMEELKLLEEDSTSLFKERLLLQALLVMQRIFTDLGHPHGLYLESLLKYADIMWTHETDLPFSMRTMSENIPINTHLFILEQLNGVDPKLLSQRSFDAFATNIFHLTFRLSELIDEKIREEESESDIAEEEPDSESYYSAQEESAEPDNPAMEKLFFEYLLALTKFIVRISEFFPNPIQISSYRFIEDNNFADIVVFLLFILEYVVVSPQITEQEKQQLEEYFSYFIRNFFPERTSTVLHKAALEAYYLNDNWSWLKKIHARINHLILHLGADVNAIDEEGQTPLHILLLDPMPPMQGNHWKEYMKIFQTLVDAGSHLYLADDNGKTVMSILRGIVKQNENDEELPNQHHFESLVNDVFPLTCLCARVIRRHRIPFQRLPPVLQKLVSL